jgi:hypothetical protein
MAPRLRPRTDQGHETADSLSKRVKHFFRASRLAERLLRSWHQVRFTAQSRKADELARNGHSLLASTQKLDRPAAMSLWVRWSNTTFMHSPFEILKRELAGSFRRFESVSDLASADIRIKEQTEGGGAENSSRTRPYREQAGRYGASSQSCTTRCKPGQKNSTGVENCQGKRVENDGGATQQPRARPFCSISVKLSRLRSRQRVSAWY